MKELSIEEKARRYDEAVINGSRLWECGEITRENYEYIFPELKESEDDRIRKAIKYGLDHVFTNNTTIFEVTKEQCLAWLEKQGKQKLINPTLEEKDKMDDAFTKMMLKDEQKPADETKLKIEEGKWYVCISQFCNCIEGRVYKATSDSRIMDNFGTEYDMHSDAYKYFRLWTIQDAKDGDILVNEEGLVFIYNGYLEEQQWPFAFGGINLYGRFNSCDGLLPFTHQRVFPATKDQRDLLFQKMKEAGYEWDAENKELKKIEQNPDSGGFWEGYNTAKEKFEQKLAWSEEDNEHLERILKELENQRQRPLNSPYLDKIESDYNWLNSIKDRVQPQPKQEWGEEDDSYIRIIIQDLERIVENKNAPKEQIIDILYNEITWLKSLRLNNIWKPSDKQMNQLGWIAEQNKDNIIGKELMTLYQDLKKLRDE